MTNTVKVISAKDAPAARRDAARRFNERYEQVTSRKTNRLIRVHDTDGATYDALLVPPDGLTDDAAREAVDAAIRSVKKAHPSDFTFDDLLLALPGFTVPSVISANEGW